MTASWLPEWMTRTNSQILMPLFSSARWGRISQRRQLKISAESTARKAPTIRSSRVLKRRSHRGESSMHQTMEFRTPGSKAPHAAITLSSSPSKSTLRGQTTLLPILASWDETWLESFPSSVPESEEFTPREHNPPADTSL